jgi:hypothetical protein
MYSTYNQPAYSCSIILHIHYVLKKKSVKLYNTSSLIIRLPNEIYKVYIYVIVHVIHPYYLNLPDSEWSLRILLIDATPLRYYYYSDAIVIFFSAVPLALDEQGNRYHYHRRSLDLRSRYQLHVEGKALVDDADQDHDCVALRSKLN